MDKQICYLQQGHSASALLSVLKHRKHKVRHDTIHLLTPYCMGYCTRTAMDFTTRSDAAPHTCAQRRPG